MCFVAKLYEIWRADVIKKRGVVKDFGQLRYELSVDNRQGDVLTGIVPS